MKDESESDHSTRGGSDALYLGRGHEPRNTGTLQKLEKARQGILPTLKFPEYISPALAQ